MTHLIDDSSIPTPAEEANAFDCLGVLKDCQALAALVSFAALARTAVRAFLEHCGAQRGVLWMDEPDVPLIEIDEGLAVREGPRGDGDGAIALPASIVDQVQRTFAGVDLDDPAMGPFGGDPYVARHRPGSILCFHVGSRTVLYLERNTTPSAFTPGSRSAIALLTTQLQVSIANCQRFRGMEERVQAGLSLERRLKEAEKKLATQERLATLGLLASTIAYEIKSPLNFITSFADLSVETAAELDQELRGESARASKLPELGPICELVADLRQNVAKIHEHGQRVDSLVRGMLQHASNRPADARQVSLNELVRGSTQAAVQARAPIERLVIDISLDDAVGVLWLRPDEIARVVLNLVDNALDAAEARARLEGPSFAAMVVVATRAKGACVELSVRDNGLGIPAAARDKVYRPFFTTKPPGAGTGLGLSVCHEIVLKGHGGTIVFATVEGEGTEFVVTFPRQAH